MAYRPMNLPQSIQQQYYLDPRMRLSARLTEQGMSTAPVQHWAQGLGRLAQALAGTYIGNKANQEYEERGRKYAEDLGTIMSPAQIAATEMDPEGGSRPATMAEMLQRAQSVRNPDLGPMVQSLAMTAAGQQAAEDQFNRRSAMDDRRWQQRFETEDQRRQRERQEDMQFRERLAKMQINASQERMPKFTTLTPEEVKAAGLPPGSSVQRNTTTGQLSVLNKPATAGTVVGYTLDGEPITAPGVRPMTEGQANAALYADRMERSNEIIRKLTTPTEDEIKAGAKPYIPGLMDDKVTGSTLGNYMLGSVFPADQVARMQEFDQAQRDFINATLRRESGAVISEQEFDNARRQYFPRAGDSPEVLKQKAANRQIAFEGIARAAGPAYEEIKRRTKKPAGEWSFQKVE